MKPICELVVVLAAAALASPLAAAPASTVTIDLTGLKRGAGDLYVSLQTRDQFMKPTGSYGEIVRKPAASSARVTLAGVAPGDYAASVWHDVDGNKAWNEGDGWAMLNGEALRAKPTFDQVRFTVGGADRTLALKTRYGYGR